MNTIYDTQIDYTDYIYLMDMLENLDYTVIAQGSQRRWDGNYPIGFYGKLTVLVEKIMTQFDDLKILEEKGHMYINAIDHDGGLTFEVKKVTDKGIDYFDRWQEKGHISEKKCHENIFKRMSVLPRIKYVI